MVRNAHQRRMSRRRGIPSIATAAERDAASRSGGWRAGLLALLRHPLLLLLVSSILVSGIGRLYNDYSERRRERAERREKLAPLLVEMRYRSLLISREGENLVTATAELLRNYDDPAAREEIAKAVNPFVREPVEPKISQIVGRLGTAFRTVQPGMLAAIRGETGSSDPQFAKVHTAAIASRIELLSGLPLQRFENPPKMAPPDWPRREVGILSALMSLEQNHTFDPGQFEFALNVLSSYTDVRESNYADDLLPIDKEVPAPEVTNYLIRAQKRSSLQQ